MDEGGRPRNGYAAAARSVRQQELEFERHRSLFEARRRRAHHPAEADFGLDCPKLARSSQNQLILDRLTGIAITGTGSITSNADPNKGGKIDE